MKLPICTYVFVCSCAFMYKGDDYMQKSEREKADEVHYV